MKNLRFFYAFVIFLFFVSCENQDDNKSTEYKNGIFIVNEGAFNAGNGSVSFFNPQTDEMFSDIFYQANGDFLGDVVQSMSISGDNGFIVVNGSGKLEKVDMKSFRRAGEPLFFSYPRFFLPVNTTTGYLSNGSSEGKVYFIDMTSFETVDSVTVGLGPENMIRLDEKVYVANSGGWGLDSTVSIIDIYSGNVTGSIVAGDVPVDLVADADQNIWVLCKGYAEYSWDPPYDLIRETEAELVKINPSADEVIFRATIGKGSDFAGVPVKMAVNPEGTIIYFIMPSGIYAMGKDDLEIPGAPLIPGYFYGVEVHPDTGEILAFESSFSSNGFMNIFSSEGTLIRRIEVGIGPNGAVFF